jgi:hypothetical protein
MKHMDSFNHKSITAKNDWLDSFGLLCLFALLVLNPFHFEVNKIFPYYRELLAAVFSVLWFIKIFAKSRLSPDSKLLVRKEVFFLVLFPGLLILFAIVDPLFTLNDPGKSLYGSDITEASLHLEAIDPKVYILRNALLYLPMVLYFAVRGLSEKEIKKIAMIILIVAPFSILTFITHMRLADTGELGTLAMLGGAGFLYNTYIPYLTFPALSAIYFMSTDANKKLKLISAFTLATISIIILLSTSRQALIFVFIGGMVFLLKNREINITKKVIIWGTSFIIALLLFFVFFSNYELHSKVVNKFTTFSGFTETKRLEKISYGLGILKPFEHISGAGLTSVVYSGPHNDFIRWWQRIGFPAMIIGFLPFFMAAYKGYASIRYRKFNALNIYIFLAILFTLFHSFFGYPREDAYQAPYCFLGLAMWLGLNAKTKLYNSIKSTRYYITQHYI